MNATPNKRVYRLNAFRNAILFSHKRSLKKGGNCHEGLFMVERPGRKARWREIERGGERGRGRSRVPRGQGPGVCLGSERGEGETQDSSQAVRLGGSAGKVVFCKDVGNKNYTFWTQFPTERVVFIGFRVEQR